MDTHKIIDLKAAMKKAEFSELEDWRKYTSGVTNWLTDHEVRKVAQKKAKFY